MEESNANGVFEVRVESPRERFAICPASFKRTHHLKRHQFMHIGQRPFSCDACSKTYGLKDHLEGHQRTHIAEKPLSCDQCCARFTQERRLLNHRSLHTGEVRFSCGLCAASFRMKSLLAGHIRQHTEETVLIVRCSESVLIIPEKAIFVIAACWKVCIKSYRRDETKSLDTTEPSTSSATNDQLPQKDIMEQSMSPDT